MVPELVCQCDERTGNPHATLDVGAAQLSETATNELHVRHAKQESSTYNSVLKAAGGWE